jgi:hypothetical protein
MRVIERKQLDQLLRTSKMVGYRLAEVAPDLWRVLDENEDFYLVDAREKWYSTTDQPHDLKPDLLNAGPDKMPNVAHYFIVWAKAGEYHLDHTYGSQYGEEFDAQLREIGERLCTKKS